jgi:hypothetical protein
MQELQKLLKDAKSKNIYWKIVLKSKEKRPLQNRIYDYRLALGLLLDYFAS